MDSVMSVLDTAGSTVLQTVSSLSSLSANVDPLDWAFSANKKTYGLPMDASLAAAILVAIALVVVVQVFVFAFCFRNGFLLRLIGGSVVATCLASTVFFLVVLLQGLVRYLLASANLSTLDLSAFFVELGASAIVGTIASAVTFIVLGKALAISFS